MTELITTDILLGPADVLFEKVIKRTGFDPDLFATALEIEMLNLGLKGKPLEIIGECLLLLEMLK